MYCPNCSLRLKKGEGFCPKCGWRFGNGESEAEPARKRIVRSRGYGLFGDGAYAHWDLTHTGQKQFPGAGRW